jgi:dimethylaniline monooxygenase (N-oxide forming)
MARVAVIGAGAAGLTSARWLRDAGLETVVFERAQAVGGIWRPDTGLAYPSLRTNTSKQKTAFSDLAFDGSLSDFPRSDEVLAYLERYADVAGIRPAIRFGRPVASVRQAENGTWTVDGEPFKFVVVATGLFARELEPPLTGRERYRGTILHSRSYRDPAAFAGRNIVVAGAGSSGADIAVDLAPLSRSVSVAIREMPVFTPKLHHGRPYDHRATRLARMLPERVRRWRTRRLIEAEYAHRGLRLERLGLHRTPGMELLDEVSAGRIVIRPALAGLDEGGAIFSDGSRADADAVILATGYAPDFPYLPDGVPARMDGALALYRLVFPPAIAGLAFVGMTRVSGPVFPLAELQARWVAAAFTGRVQLPPAEEMRAEIEHRIARARVRRDDQMRVELLPYADDIAGRIGAKPSIWRHPGLLVSPVSAADYRPTMREP